MALGKPSSVSLGLVVVVLGLIGYLAWQSTTKEDTENFKGGKAEYNAFSYFYPLSIPGCGPNLKVDGTPIRTKK